MKRMIAAALLVLSVGMAWIGSQPVGCGACQVLYTGSDAVVLPDE